MKMQHLHLVNFIINPLKLEQPMKRILFVLVSAFFAVTSFATNLGKDVVTRIVNDDESTISQQNETLILEQPAGYDLSVADHCQMLCKTHNRAKGNR